MQLQTLVSVRHRGGVDRRKSTDGCRRRSTLHRSARYPLPQKLIELRFTKGISTATSCMTAKSFVNTKVVLYTIGKNARKADIAREFVGAQPSISTQVVNESISGVSDGQSRRWINMPCGSQIQTPP
jgi:hypothetical protein